MSRHSNASGASNAPTTLQDLLVYVADADAEAFLNEVLQKHHALGIHRISFTIKRHPQRDAGMWNTGAELARLEKGKYRYVLLMFDHHGSGQDSKKAPHVMEQELQNKLDTYTWTDHNAVVLFVPELEQ